jgi:hypothetical protein
MILLGHNSHSGMAMIQKGKAVGKAKKQDMTCGPCVGALQDLLEIWSQVYPKTKLGQCAYPSNCRNSPLAYFTFSENEPDIRRLLHYHTSWTAMEDEKCKHGYCTLISILICVYLAVAIARTLAQALSNIVTSNEPLTAMLWETYMNLPEDQVILMYGKPQQYSVP